MKYLFLIIPFFLSSCANVSSTRLLFKSEKSTLIVEMPKEVEAKNLRIEYDSQQGTFKITSDSWISANQGTLAAQAVREKMFLEGSSTLIEKAVEGGVREAMKGVIPTR